jgi:predicted ATPase
MTEAVAQLREGLDLLSSTPDATARQEQELDLQLALGQALNAAKGLAAPEVGEAFARARQLCEKLDQPPQLPPILIGQWLYRLGRGEHEQAEGLAQEVRHLGEARSDVTWKCFGSFVSGQICFYLGKFIDGRVHLENGLSHWDPTFRASWALPDDAYVGATLHLSKTLLYLGYVDQARLRLGETLAEAQRLSPFDLVFALCHAWYGDWASQGMESAPTMLQSADKVLAISAEQGFPIWSARGNIMLGWCLGAAGQAAEGIQLLLKGIADAGATGCNIVVPFCLMVLAQVYGEAGQPEEGLNRLVEAARLVETTQERWAEAEMHRLRGTLLLSMREHAEAENSYRQALSVAQRQSAKFWELRAATSLARLWRDQGKRTEARDLLAPVYGGFTEGFDTPVLRGAKALLDELA